jgi:hypothetical protein
MPVGTQTEIARAIRDERGEYCMSLEKNWRAVHAEVASMFNNPAHNVAFETKETVDLTGGWIETRRHTVCHKVDCVRSDRRDSVFPDLATIGRVETQADRGRRDIQAIRLIDARAVLDLLGETQYATPRGRRAPQGASSRASGRIRR